VVHFNGLRYHGLVVWCGIVDELHETLVQRIKVLVATKKNLTLTALAVEVGRSHFWDVIGGRRSPTLRWVSKVAKVLEVEPRSLLMTAARRGSKGLH
jgi:DNA-binding phage protein